MADEIVPTLSIVMPIYNEEECIAAVVHNIHSTILARLPGSELLAINDGSQDSTPQILDELAERFPQVIPYHKENGGHGDALLYGLKRARGRFIFLTDSDGQTDPEDFWLLWDRRGSVDFVSGVRSERHDPLHRLVLTRLLRFAIVVFFGIRCSDANVPFKLFKYDFGRRLSPYIPPDTVIPSLFICLAANRCLDGVEEVNIRHLPRATGTCTIRYFKLVRFCARAFFQFLRFRWSAWSAMMPSWRLAEEHQKKVDTTS